MKGCLREVFEDEDQIELLEAVLDTLEGGDFNLGKGDDEERGIGEVDKALSRGLESNICSERNTFEG